MDYTNITPEEFTTLPPDKQMQIMKDSIKNWSKEDLAILKALIEKERKFSQ